MFRLLSCLLWYCCGRCIPSGFLPCVQGNVSASAMTVNEVMLARDAEREQDAAQSLRIQELLERGAARQTEHNAFMARWLAMGARPLANADSIDLPSVTHIKQASWQTYVSLAIFVADPLGSGHAELMREVADLERGAQATAPPAVTSNVDTNIDTNEQDAVQCAVVPFQ